MPPDESSATGPVPPEPVAAVHATPLVPARVYLKPADIPPPNVGAYGVFALRGLPTAASRDRLLMACASFVAYLTSQSGLSPSVKLQDQMLTVWPVDNPAASEVQANNCDYLLDHYALAAADSAISDAFLQHGDINGQGPFLIGWSPSDARGKPDKLVLVVNMSAYSTQDSFDHAFMFWKQKVVENPQLWRTGWSLDQYRLAIRDFADHYGSAILSAAHLSDTPEEKN